MKNQALFSSKDKSKKLKCCLLQILFGALRVNEVNIFANNFEIICRKNCFEISCGEKIYLHSTLLITDSKHQNRML